MTYPIIETFVLAMGRVRKYDRHTHEIIARSGFIGQSEVEEYLSFLHDEFEKPFRILVHRKHEYKYSLDAARLLQMGNAPKVYAVLVYSKASKRSFEASVGMAVYSVFSEHPGALDWLMNYSLEQIV